MRALKDPRLIWPQPLIGSEGKGNRGLVSMIGSRLVQTLTFCMLDNFACFRMGPSLKIYLFAVLLPINFNWSFCYRNST